jgi:hypothetical protein
MMMPIYCKLFNLILNTGKIPNSWSEGIILPIYKNKGSVSEPSSYRPITLVSCLGKTFTAILNNRLSQLSDEIELITEAQTGFRKGYDTIDDIFTLCFVLYLPVPWEKIVLYLRRFLQGI